MNTFTIRAIADMLDAKADGTYAMTEDAAAFDTTFGYWVGGVAPSCIFSDYGRLDEGTADVVTWWNRYGKGQWFAGMWTDAETGAVYLDVSEHYNDREEAERVGRQRGEIAIWDIANNKEIRL